MISVQEKFSLQIGGFFKSTLGLLIKQPKLWLKANFIFKQQRHGVRVRHRLSLAGLEVPPLMIFSITNKCNLRCQGCYHRAQSRPDEQLTAAEVERIFAEARDLGISLILVAGGEPFTRNDLISIIRKFPEILFVVFTNGVLIDPKIISEINQLNNLVPVVSLEGGQSRTDLRRGRGIFSRLTAVFSGLKNSLYGVSFTVTKDNLSEITDEKFVTELINLGVSVFFYIEYVPFETGTENKVLGDTERKLLADNLTSLRKKLPAMFVSFPGDEDQYGGCLAAGRGFIHVSASGQIEPCPFAPYSDISLKNSSLKDALSSKLLARIRSLPENLRETGGGCALFAHRQEVFELKHDQ